MRSTVEQATSQDLLGGVDTATSEFTAKSRSESIELRARSIDMDVDGVLVVTNEEVASINLNTVGGKDLSDVLVQETSRTTVREGEGLSLRSIEWFTVQLEVLSVGIVLKDIITIDLNSVGSVKREGWESLGIRVTSMDGKDAILGARQDVVTILVNRVEDVVKGLEVRITMRAASSNNSVIRSGAGARTNNDALFAVILEDKVVSLLADLGSNNIDAS